MTKPEAFWDTSVLVQLCVQQQFSAAARALHARYNVVVWWATPVEIAGALARLLRIQQIDTITWKLAREEQARLSRIWYTVRPSQDLRDAAELLVERYDVHSADALQLAAAMEWCEKATHRRPFLTLDKRLRDAALLCGFDAPQI